MPDNNNFSELFIHTLKQNHVRLDRLEAKIDEKTDKQDINVLQVKFDRKSISVNFRNNNPLRPRPGRFGLQPNRILRGNRKNRSAPDPVGSVCNRTGYYAEIGKTARSQTR